jgi:hypothetical protein
MVNEPLYVSIDGKGDDVHEVVGFTGGDWQHWVIVRVGDRLRSYPLEDLRIKTAGEYNQAQTMRRLAEEGY